MTNPEDYAAEHDRLLRESADLRREHSDLERRPFDAIEHRAHKMRLKSNIAQLRAHSACALAGGGDSAKGAELKPHETEHAGLEAERAAAWKLLEQSFHEFRDAHALGMSSLQSGDYESFGRAVEHERRAVHAYSDALAIFHRYCEIRGRLGGEAIRRPLIGFPRIESPAGAALLHEGWKQAPVVAFAPQGEMVCARRK